LVENLVLIYAAEVVPLPEGLLPPVGFAPGLITPVAAFVYYFDVVGLFNPG
jgi:hypothetical protein